MRRNTTRAYGTGEARDVKVRFRLFSFDLQLELGCPRAFQFRMASCRRNVPVMLPVGRGDVI